MPGLGKAIGKDESEVGISATSNIHGRSIYLAAAHHGGSMIRGTPCVVSSSFVHFLVQL
jgi:hypothetical protein